MIIPEGYHSKLTVYQTQRAIELVKQSFAKNLCKALDLKRVSAPLFVSSDSGINDNLNGIERPVEFEVSAAGGAKFQIVQSLAKWKRLALKRYDFHEGKGLYTDMNAIRRDEPVLDNLHSVYVDQWDWEKVMSPADRTEVYLRQTVERIVNAICDTRDEVESEFPGIAPVLSREVKFVTTQELEDRYPDLTPSQRDNAITKEYSTVFLMQVGKTLRSGAIHDGRAPDYDDWELNGDIIFRNELLDRDFEVSSMGIRVNPEVLRRQLAAAGCEERASLPFHKMLLDGELPQTIGGGIGQSRLCMLLIGAAHVGEVQAGAWSEEDKKACEAAGIRLL